MKRNLIALCSLLAVAMIVPARSADWPQFRGPQADGISKEKLANINWQQKAPDLLWKIDLNDESYSGPSVVGNKVYIVGHASDSDIIKCLDLKTGTTAWDFTYPDPGNSNFGYTRATPSVSKGLLVTLSRQGLVFCLDAKTGKLIWKRDLIKDFGGSMPNWGHSASPLIDGTKVIVSPGGKDASVAALDLKTGETIWQGGGSDAASYSTPIKAQILGSWQYIILSASLLKGIDIRNGQVLWQSEFKTNGGINIPMPIVIGNSVFITASYGMGSALIDILPNVTTAVKWRNKNMLAHFSTPILMNGYIYGVGDPGKLMCIDPNDGSQKWAVEGFEKGPSLAIGRYLLTLVGNTGELVLSKPSPEKYQELCRMPTLGGQSWTAPVFANGMLLIRNTKTLGCYNMR